MTDERIEAHITVESADANAIDLLQQETGLPRQRIKFAMSQGAVWLTRGRNTQRLRRAKRTLRPGDKLHLYYDAEILAEVPPQPELIADVGEYSVWHKPFGLRSQGSKWGDHCTITRWAERHLEPERPAFTVHRLDRAANGLILVAHSKKTAAALSALFRERKIEKRYRALAKGDFSSQPAPLRVEEPLDGKDAISEFSLVEVSDDGACSQVDVSIETGRKHQVRRHLASVGFPIIGDRQHGEGEEDGVDLQLTAYRLAFHCPVGDAWVAYEIPVSHVELYSTITCPHCGHAKRELMPTNACQFFYECEGCGVLLKPEPGDCCVYCSYGDTKCPPIQEGACCCSE